MKFSFTGKNLVVSADMKSYAEKKIGRLERIFPDNPEVLVTFSVVKLENKVEVSIPLKKRLLRAEVVSADMYAAIDGVTDVLERQMVKYKQRMKDKSRRDQAFKDEFEMLSSVSEDAADGTDIITIDRMKHFPLKPMDPEEAIVEMELLGHTFFVFRHSETFEINVVYKRRQGTYGLIDPNDPIDEE